VKFLHTGEICWGTKFDSLNVVENLNFKIRNWSKEQASHCEPTKTSATIKTAQLIVPTTFQISVEK
jgi:hypothetical protein